MNIWLLRFEDFVLFLKEKKRHPKTDSKNKEERSLAMWVIAQRFKYRNSKLNQEKIKNLESIECWKWDPNEEAWKKNFNDIIEFIENNKYYPSTNYKTPEEGFLGRWVSVQRKLYKQSKLDQQKVAKLESLSGWTWDVHEENWQKHFIELTDFLNKHKTYPKERSKNKDEKSLGKWIAAQRVVYNKSKLDPQRIAQLESLAGWMWDVIEEAWEKNFRNLLEFIDKNKVYPRSSSKNLRERFLARWFLKQRKEYKNKNLQQKMICKLESIPNWMWNCCK